MKLVVVHNSFKRHLLRRRWLLLQRNLLRRNFIISLNLRTFAAVVSLVVIPFVVILSLLTLTTITVFLSNAKAADAGYINKLDLSIKQDEPRRTDIIKEDILAGAENAAAKTVACDFMKSQKLERVSGHVAEIIGLFAPDCESGQRAVISADKQGHVVLWKLDQAGAWRLFDLPHAIEQVAYCPAGQLLAVAGGSQVEVYSLKDNSNLAKLSRIQTRPTGLDFHPNCQSVLIAGTNGTIFRWKFVAEQEASTAKEQDLALERYLGSSTVISSVVFHPFGRFFFSGDWRGGLSAWLTYDSDVFGGEYNKNIFISGIFAKDAPRVTSSVEGAPRIEKLVLSQDGQSLFVATQNGVIEWWDVRGLKKLASIQAHKGAVFDIAVSADAKRLASVGRDGKVKGWTLSEQSADRKTPAAFAPGQELPLPNVLKLTFAGSDLLLAGEKSGRILDLKAW